MKVEAYIHSLKDKENDRHVLGEVEIIGKIGDNLYLANYEGVNGVHGQACRQSQLSGDMRLFTTGS